MLQFLGWIWRGCCRFARFLANGIIFLIREVAVPVFIDQFGNYVYKLVRQELRYLPA